MSATPDDPTRPDEAPGDEVPAGTAASAGEDVCPTCAGSGRADGGECPGCGGTGRVQEAVGGG